MITVSLDRMSWKSGLTVVTSCHHALRRFPIPEGPREDLSTIIVENRVKNWRVVNDLNSASPSVKLTTHLKTVCGDSSSLYFVSFSCSVGQFLLGQIVCVIATRQWKTIIISSTATIPILESRPLTITLEGRPRPSFTVQPPNNDSGPRCRSRR